MARMKKFEMGTYGGDPKEDIKGKLAGLEKKEKEMELQQVPYEKIIRNPDNRDAEKNIEGLTESIEAVGLLDPLRVRETEDGSYMLVAGERRWRAIGKIRERNPYRFSLVPVFIETKEEDSLVTALKFLDSNEQREDLTPQEKRKAIAQIEALYKSRKENGERVGESVTKRIASALRISERQVQKLSSINRKLIPELQQVFDERKLSVNAASAIGNMDEIYQKELYGIFRAEGEISQEDVETYKKEDRRLKEENGELKEELAKIRKEYEEETRRILEETETGGEQEQLKELAEAKERKNKKEARIAEKVVLKRRVTLSPEYSKRVELDKAINRLSKAQYSLRSVIEDGTELDELGRYRISEIIEKLSSLL